MGVSVLLYADDIILIGDSAEDLQRMLDTVYKWSVKFMIKFNARKSNIVHFRNPRSLKTDFNFHLGNVNLDIVSQYKYLGIILNEFLDYNVTTQTLSEAAKRALGAIINKYKAINGIYLI